ncbi:hypothetical protein [Streptomyces sp. NPDC088925]|uniref:hypothetical protein n=1 Tax=Streptomyces sp. NPDC088925 TaxID=3365914 RepID=UPI0037F3DC3E
MTPNGALASRMRKAGHTQSSLAQAVNDRVEENTGASGTVSDRTVRYWLTGKSVWPRRRLRDALEAEFGCTSAELGFVAPAPRSPEVEDPMRRRTALTAAALFVAGSLPQPAAAASRVGMADAERLEHAFTTLVADDNENGGSIGLESRATAFAHHATDLQTTGSPAPRVRARLYYLAALFTGTALWASIDARNPDRAQGHLDRAMTLASLAGSSEMRLRLLGHAASLSAQQGRFHDALAAAEAARLANACARDPLLRSLAVARLAVRHAELGNARAADRAFDTAATALSRSDPAQPRPAWVGFYDESELAGLWGLAMLDVGRPVEAEAHLHTALARLRPGYVRNRRYYTAHLALAQLRQGEADRACATIAPVLADQGGASLTARTGALIFDFTRELVSRAPDAACTRLWAEQYRYYQGSRT